MSGMTRIVGRVRQRSAAIVVALAITETISFGIMLYGFGTFLPSMEREFHWSKLTISGGLSVGLLVSGIAGLWIGRHLDKRSPRLLMTVGSVIGSACVFGWSHIETLTQFYVLWAVMGLAMGATFYEPAFIVLSQWFEGRARQRALTIVTLVAGLASTIFVPWEEYLIRTRGWRPALRVLALLMFVVTVPLHALVLRQAPSRRVRNETEDASIAGHIGMTVDEAMKDSRFWALLSASFLLGLTFAALISHQVSLLQERGWTSRSAAAATGSIGLWQLGGRIVFTPLVRWFSVRVVTVMVWCVQVLSLVVLALGSSPLMIALFAATAGVSRGLYTLVRATSVAELFGTANYGGISSRIALPTTIAQAGGPILGSLFFRATGNYDLMVWILAGLAFMATIFATRIHHNDPMHAPRFRAV